MPQAGSAVEVEYDVPDAVWYFEQNGFPVMPFGVLMEVVLQASGWLASYVGSALGHDEDLLFRNLDGTGTVLREIRPGTRVLRTRTRLLDIAHSGDMIIETFGVECFADGEPVFSLTTVFGFFPRPRSRTRSGCRRPTTNGALWSGRATSVSSSARGPRSSSTARSTCRARCC